MDIGEKFFNYPVFLRINFSGFSETLSYYEYLAKIVQNRSLANLVCGSLDVGFFDLFIMASALPFFRNAGRYFEFQDAVCLLLEKYFGRYEFVR